MWWILREGVRQAPGMPAPYSLKAGALQADLPHLSLARGGGGKEVGVAAAGHAEHAAGLLGAELRPGAVNLRQAGVAGGELKRARGMAVGRRHALPQQHTQAAV